MGEKIERLREQQKKLLADAAAKQKKATEIEKQIAALEAAEIKNLLSEHNIPIEQLKQYINEMKNKS